MDEHKPHSQHTSAEDCQLWELAFEYPPLYEALEDLLADASDMSAPETLKEIINAYQTTEEETFKKIAFERILNERFGHNVKEILRLLNETHGSTFTPKRVPLGLDFITDERQLELIVLNIIAGALIAYHIPEVYKEDGKNAGALKQLYPSEKVIKLSQKLYKAIRDDRLWVGDFKHSLWDLSQGEPLETQLLRSEKPQIKLECLIKEITLLSERHLTMRTKGKGRFPTLAVIEISKIVQHFPKPDVRTVSPIQKKYAKKYKEEPLVTKWTRFFVSPDL
jgi:hypothetical protein